MYVTYGMFNGVLSLRDAVEKRFTQIKVGNDEIWNACVGASYIQNIMIIIAKAMVKA